MSWASDNWIVWETAFWIVSVGALTNVACALIGCFLVLRQMSLMGDALSHAVLPGLVLAFIFTGSLNIFPLFLGAVAVGLLTTFLTQTLHQFGKLHTDASMGVAFTSLFALGVVLLKRNIQGMHFDAACVYQGSLLQVALNTVPVGNLEVPRQIFTIGPVLLFNLVFVTLLWKELKITSFDPGLAYTVGISAAVMHYVLMAIVAVTTVASFEAVGSILVVAMLIVPGATAHLLTDRLGRMLLIAAIVGVAAAVVGYALASWWQVEPAGAMTVVVGACYALAVLFSPRYGVVSKLVNNLRTSLRVICEDILAMLYRVEEIGGDRRLTRDDASKAVGGGMLAAWGIRALVKNGQVSETTTDLILTKTGRRQASRLVRSHRLWESYLVQQLGLPADHVHEPAERIEHYISDRMRAALESELDDTARDPHGREIPD